MEDDCETNAGNYDVLLWRILSDAIQLALGTANQLVNAASMDLVPHADAVARNKVDALNRHAMMLLVTSRKLQDRLDGVGAHAEFDRIVRDFWKGNASDL